MNTGPDLLTFNDKVMLVQVVKCPVMYNIYSMCNEIITFYCLKKNMKPL